jgi:putative PIN family toxin of toxin-antitoxin system
VRIVLDTNVLVSALLNPQGPPGRILDFVLAGKAVLLVDDRILDEYRDVLTRRRFAFDAAEVATLLAFLDAESEWVAATGPPFTLTDPGDQPFAEVAVAAGADFLVTGNPRHFPPSRLPTALRIATPAHFLGLALRDA